MYEKKNMVCGVCESDLWVDCLRMDQRKWGLDRNSTYKSNWCVEGVNAAVARGCHFKVDCTLMT